VEFFVIAAVCP